MSFVPLSTKSLYALSEDRPISAIIRVERKDNPEAKAKFALFDISGMGSYPVDEDLSQFGYIQDADRDFSEDTPAWILFELFDPEYCTGEDDPEFRGIPFVASEDSFKAFAEENYILPIEKFL